MILGEMLGLHLKNFSTRNGLRERFRGANVVSKKLVLLLILTTLIFTVGSGTVSAEVIIESWGPGYYGWMQVFESTVGAPNLLRLTGSADRQYYDFGYKQIQISGRRENYWSKDCGWWYVTEESVMNITMIDAAGDYIVVNETATTTKGQTLAQTYEWGADDDPGRWNVTVKNDTLTARFYIYVRGQLNVTNITTNATNPLYPNKGDRVEINATLKDNAGNYVNWSYWDNEGNDVTPKNVIAYITGGGDEFVINLTNYEGDGGWRGNFTPQKVGDHLIIVKASDGHQYWVDGRGSQWISVNGTYLPNYDEFASVGLWMFMGGLDGLGDKVKLSALFASLLGLVFIKVRWR